MDTLSKFLNPGISFLVTVAFGFWLSQVGKPYNGVLFNFHKLIALGTVVITAMQIYKLVANSEPQTLLLILIVVTGVCVVALFASGAFMSIGNLNHQTMKLIHNIAPVLAVIAMATMVYMLFFLKEGR